MAEANTATAEPDVPSILDTYPGLRQALLLVGVAVAVSAGVALTLWTQSPDMRVLYPSTDPMELGAMTSALDSVAIPYEITPGSGALSVPADELQKAQMLLAGQGLPRSRGVSVDSLYEGSGYSTSQFMETKFYTHALENKLAGVISSLNTVKSAEVTLGLPKQSVFVRERKQPTASVVLHLYPGRALEPAQSKAIVHLVAASVPNLETGNVTLLDQNSNLLSTDSQWGSLGAATHQFDYKRRVENALAENIDALLVPIVGLGRSRTKVVAQMDFSEVEETSERFDPNGQVVRSEQSKEQESTGSTAALGVPGALTNQPPTAPQPEEDAATPAQSRATDRVLNYEVDRTISRVRPQRGDIVKLSVAVVLDYLPGVEPGETVEGVGDAAANTAEEQATNAEGTEPAAIPLTEDQLEQIRAIIRDAVGFDEARGDTLSLVNTPFQAPVEPAPVEPPPLWEQPWVIDIGKALLGGIALIVLLLAVLRPFLQGLVQAQRTQVATRAATEAALAAERQAAELAEKGIEQGQDGSAITAGSSAGALPQPGSRDPMKLAQELATADPKRVAQVVKNWVADEA